MRSLCSTRASKDAQFMKRSISSRPTKCASICKKQRDNHADCPLLLISQAKPASCHAFLETNFDAGAVARTIDCDAGFYLDPASQIAHAGASKRPAERPAAVGIAHNWVERGSS